MDPAPNTQTLGQPGPGRLDYLILGHVTLDHAQPEPRLGGTGAYAGLTAHALGLRVGLVTSCRADLDLSELSGLAIERRPSGRTTTFENTGQGRQRRQVLTDRADDLNWESIPAAWRSAPIVHLAPVAGEVDPAWAAAFPGAFVGLTPQGWWRIWDSAGRVDHLSADMALGRLPHAQAAVFSLQDIRPDSEGVRRLARVCDVTAVTDGPEGADLVWGQNTQHVPARPSRLVDDTGAGDIFAAAFFIHLTSGHTPLEAAQAATRWASASVEQPGLAGVGASAMIASAGALRPL